MSSAWGYELPVILGLYLLAIMYIGYYSYKKRKGVTAHDFFLASRLLGYIVLGVGLFATIASGNTFVGYSGKAYRAGLFFMVAPAFYVSILVGLLLVAPRLIPLASKKGYISPGDFFQDRFKSRALTLILVLTMFWATFVQFFEQSIAMGYIGNVASGGYLPYSISAAIFMTVVIFVMLVGGFRGTALANFVMGAVMIAGMIGFMVVILPTLGGAGALAKVAQTLPSKVAPPTGIKLTTWFSTLLLVLFGILCYFQIAMYLMAAKDFGTWRKTYWYTPAIYVMVPTLFVIGGIIGLAIFPGLSTLQSDKIVPMLLAKAASISPLGYGFSELLLIAVVSATLSTAAAVIFSLGMVLARDIYTKYINPRADEKRVIWVSKGIMVALAILGYIIVMTPHFTLWRWVELKFEIGMQAVPALLLGLYVPWANKKGIGAGLVTGVILAIALNALGYPKIMGWHSGVLCFFLNFVIAIIVSYATRRKEEIEEAKRLMSLVSEGS